VRGSETRRKKGEEQPGSEYTVEEQTGSGGGAAIRGRERVGAVSRERRDKRFN